MPVPPVVELRGASKRYGGTQALQGLDLALHPGEVLGFLGPNGAGKTTAIKLMLGLTRPSGGQVLLFGGDPQERSARQRVGVMLQESGVPTSLKVRELLRLFQRYYPWTLPTAELLERADLAEKAEALVSTLSGGQRQRLYFALAIAGDPDLLFLDEPTVALDVDARRAFWTQVRGFAALGKTILFSTHHLEEADALASRIVVIDRGRLIAQGSPAEIKRQAAAKTVRFASTMEAHALAALPMVQGAERQGDHLLAYTNEPEALLQRLFADGRPVSGLTVTDTDLETAFIGLTRGAERGAPAKERRP